MNNEKYSIVIIDDETEILNVLSRFLIRNPNFSVNTYSNPISALNSIENTKVDLVLLDIMMPLLNGMETAHEIRKNDSVVKIIFLTSSPEFALESYDVKASGYLLKPTTYEKLCSLLNDCKQAFHYEPESIIVKTDKGYRKIYYHLIECVEAQNKKVLFCLNDGECLEVLDTFVHCSNELTSNDAFAQNFLNLSIFFYRA